MDPWTALRVQVIDEPWARDAAAMIWAAAVARREGETEVASLEVARAKIDAVLDSGPRSVLAIASITDTESVVGFAAIEADQNSSDGSGAELHYFGVSPHAWGHGVATTLLRELPQLVSRLGYATLELSVHVENAAAVAAYRRAGWQKLGTPSPHPRTGKPVQRYQLTLTPTP